MARSVALVAPGPLDARTGGYVYNGRMLAELTRLGWSVSALALDPSFPYPTPAALAHAAAVLRAMPDGSPVIIDSLALGAMPAVVSAEASRLRIVALVHLPLAAAVDLDAATAARFRHDEGIALRAAALVVVTGRAALPMLAPYGIPDDRVMVIEPGADPPSRAAHASARQVSDVVELVCIATVKAGKGHERLLTALAEVPHTHWHLTCAGSLTRDVPTVGRVRATIEQFHLEDRVTLAGDLGGDALETCYTQADVFVMATRQETYGMAVAEALAHGLPVVATRTSAIVDLVGDEAGILVPMDDDASLRDALTRIIGDPGLRDRLAEGARRARTRLPTWDDAGGAMSAALDRLAAHG